MIGLQHGARLALFLENATTNPRPGLSLRLLLSSGLTCPKTCRRRQLTGSYDAIHGAESPSSTSMLSFSCRYLLLRQGQVTTFAGRCASRDKPLQSSLCVQDRKVK